MVMTCLRASPQPHLAGQAMHGVPMPGPWRMPCGNARLLERLTANLIDNAIRHNIPGGHLGIQVTTTDGHPTLSISNTGPVVPADQIPRLLQPFQRLHGSRPAAGDGPGLGPSVVAAIARAHHATLAVSPGPHGGLIVITFPQPRGPPWHSQQRSPQHDQDHCGSRSYEPERVICAPHAHV